MLESLRSEKPFFHTPKTIDHSEEKEIFEGHVVNGFGATWSKLDTNGTHSHEYTAPWYEPHYSVSATLWDPKKKIYTFILAQKINMTSAWTPKHEDQWEIVQSYFVKDGVKHQFDGMYILSERIIPCLNK
jgi:hypothetical protein